eukprot:1873034-Rhodomonas_salina.1
MLLRHVGYGHSVCCYAMRGTETAYGGTAGRRGGEEAGAGSGGGGKDSNNGALSVAVSPRVGGAVWDDAMVCYVAMLWSYAVSLCYHPMLAANAGSGTGTWRRLLCYQPMGAWLPAGINLRAQYGMSAMLLRQCCSTSVRMFLRRVCCG